MKNKRWIFFSGAVVLVLAAGVFLLNLLGGGILFQVAANAVAGRALSCEQLPATAEAEAVVADHRQLFDRVEAVNADFVFVHVSPEAGCPGRATLTITYATESDRQAIEAILQESPGRSRPAAWQFPRLFGAPYRLVNT